MKYKLYKATDKLDGSMTKFLVRQDGFVATSFFLSGSDKSQLSLAKDCSELYFYSKPERFNDATNPILIGEFEV